MKAMKTASNRIHTIYVRMIISTSGTILAAEIQILQEQLVSIQLLIM